MHKRLWITPFLFAFHLFSGGLIASQCPPMDKNNIPRIDSEGIKLLEKCIAEQAQTKQMPQNFNPATGNYTATRMKLHEKIILNALDKKSCVTTTSPVAIFMGGLPGSGKSTFKKKHINPIFLNNSVEINVDSIRVQLPENLGWNADNTQKESVDIATKLLQQTMSPCKYNIIYDSTLSKLDKGKKLITQLLKNGYKVYLIEMSIPDSVSAKRVLQRYQTGTGEDKLRYVPITVIKKTAIGNKEAFKYLKNICTGYAEYDSVKGVFISKQNMGDILK